MECSHGRKPVVRVARQDPSPGGATETHGSHPSPLPGLMCLRRSYSTGSCPWLSAYAPAGAYVFAPFSFWLQGYSMPPLHSEVTEQ